MLTINKTCAAEADLARHLDDLGADERRAEYENKQRADARAAFLAKPDADAIWSMCDLGGPSSDAVAQYLIAQYMAGESGATEIMSALADQAARWTEIED